MLTVRDPVPDTLILYCGSLLNNIIIFTIIFDVLAIVIMIAKYFFA